MPLGNLTTETFYGQEVINSDDLNRLDYNKNQQVVIPTPLVQPLQNVGQQPKPEPKKVYKKTDDAGLKKALKKDNAKRNIT